MGTHFKIFPSQPYLHSEKRVAQIISQGPPTESPSASNCGLFIYFTVGKREISASKSPLPPSTCLFHILSIGRRKSLFIKENVISQRYRREASLFQSRAVEWDGGVSIVADYLLMGRIESLSITYSK